MQGKRWVTHTGPSPAHRAGLGPARPVRLPAVPSTMAGSAPVCWSGTDAHLGAGAGSSRSSVAAAHGRKWREGSWLSR